MPGLVPGIHAEQLMPVVNIFFLLHRVDGKEPHLHSAPPQCRIGKRLQIDRVRPLKTPAF
jgi:hypothetical protein